MCSNKIEITSKSYELYILLVSEVVLLLSAVTEVAGYCKVANNCTV
jgi:hypothetical protein